MKFEQEFKTHCELKRMKRNEKYGDIDKASLESLVDHLVEETEELWKAWLNFRVEDDSKKLKNRDALLEEVIDQGVLIRALFDKIYGMEE